MRAVISILIFVLITWGSVFLVSRMGEVPQWIVIATVLTVAPMWVLSLTRMIDEVRDEWEWW